MSADPPTCVESPPADSHGRAATEIALLVVLFLLFTGWQLPGINEAHYLAKLKHFWNPEWCRGDLLLESADAHWLFYFLFGWLSRWLPLPWVAWCGRGLMWLLLAVTLRRLLRRVLPTPAWVLPAAAALLALLHHGHMAGEWFVEGVEAKGFAYVLLFAGLAELASGKWNRVWLWFGGSAAFHVLVGGWGVVAAVLVWLADARRPPLRGMLPSLAVGGLLSLPGLLPALVLMRNVDPETAARAAEIYVFDRLAHHLVFDSFPPHYKARFLAISAAWFFLWRLGTARAAAQTTLGEGVERIQRFVAAALLICACGVAIDYATVEHPAIAARLLRYYWFRLSDFAVPLGVVVGLAAAAHRAAEPFSFRGVRWLPAAALGLAGLLALAPSLARNARVDYGPADAPEYLADPTAWRDTCRWIAENTEPEALFLTPWGQQTFKWHAGRAEVVTRKDVPQDAAAILEWRRRYEDIYESIHPLGWIHRHISAAERTDDDLRRLAARYGFQYLVVERFPGLRRPGFPRVYPPEEPATAGPTAGPPYEVYRIDPAEEETPAAGGETPGDD